MRASARQLICHTASRQRVRGNRRGQKPQPRASTAFDRGKTVVFERAVPTRSRRSPPHRASNDARVAALNTKLHELRSAQAGEQPSAKAGGQPSANDLIEAMKSPEAWATFAKDWPDFHAPISEYVEARVSHANSQIKADVQKQIDEAIQPLKAAEAKQQTTREVAALDAAHPDWRGVVVSSQFQTWMLGQSADRHQQLNGDSSQEVATVLAAYKEALASSPSPAKKLNDKRKKQLERSSGIPSQPGFGAEGVVPVDDFDAAFDALPD